MAEVHEIHEEEEYEPVEPRRRGVMVPIIMFLLGGALIAGLIVAFLNVSSTISWPAGQVSLGPNATVAQANAPAVTPSTIGTAPSAVVPPATQSEESTADNPSSTSTPPAAADSTTENPVPPADTTTPENE